MNSYKENYEEHGFFLFGIFIIVLSVLFYNSINS